MCRPTATVDGEIGVVMKVPNPAPILIPAHATSPEVAEAVLRICRWTRGARPPIMPMYIPVPGI